ncbi:efflux RND transporter periplasmic adaptor subunit [sulfur-oxidizing endosymbiont of Gigantopelta aegis]|uniref:efflux RND transporter periplasmic adaptor subunit n=1 Tax=sulfur-oxidizing endosymbiont of Gigantopelta aegis TaxID=2794934 RepID=UPI0018DD2173|nr:efflux RND transporter periplasmic adaptor subunit [sulfur-oxidizing endosymbiont of Gigantopelta aegis]
MLLLTVLLIVLLTGLLANVPALAQGNLLAKAIPVTVKALQELTFHPIKKAPAQVVSLQSSLLSAELSARVISVEVKIGDSVKKDQLLLSLECDDYVLKQQQLLAEKRALLAEKKFADYQWQRSKQLIKSKSVSQEAHRRLATEVEKLSARIDLQQGRVKQAQKNISRCQVVAPYSGVIAERFIHVGEYVRPNTPLVQLIDVDDLEVEVQMPIVLVDTLDYTALNFIYRKQRYPLHLRAIIPSVETRARHQRVRLSFVAKKASPDAAGMVEMILRSNNIPANYLVKRNAQVGLFLLEKRSLEKRSLEKRSLEKRSLEKRSLEKGKLEKINDKSSIQWQARFWPLKNALIGRAAEIDLPSDTQVIISGRNALSDGQPVLLNTTQQRLK